MPINKKILDLRFHPTESDGRTVILYQPEKGGRALTEEEKLTLTLTNIGQGPIEFVNTDEDVSCLWFYIHDNNREFTRDEVASFQLGFTDPPGKEIGWTAQVDNNGYNALRITPDRGFTLEESESVVLGLENFRGNPMLIRRDLFVDTENIPGAMEDYEKLVVVKQVREGARPLKLRADYMESNTVYVSESRTLKTTNPLRFYLKNDEGSRQTETIRAAENTFIRLSFDYGKGPGRITETEDAVNFRLSILDDFGNTYAEPEAPKDPKNPSWELYPTNGVFLAKSPANRLALEFTGITTRTPGIATLHLEHVNVPERIDGYCGLDIIKVAPDFNIINFNAGKVNLESDQKAALNWKVVSAKYATLQFKKYDELQTISTDDEHSNLGDKFKEIDGARAIELNQNKDFEIDIYEDTYFTLSAYGERIVGEPGADRYRQELYIRDQRQLFVSVVPSLRQYALQCFYTGDNAMFAVVKCVRKFDLELSDDLEQSDKIITDLVKNLKKAGFKDDPIYEAAVKYYYRNGESDNWVRNEKRYKKVIKDILR